MRSIFNSFIKLCFFLPLAGLDYVSRIFSERKRPDIISALEQKNISLLSELINKDTALLGITYKGKSLLITACEKNFLEGVKILISAGAKVDEFSNVGKYPIVFASQENNTDLVKILIQNGANVNINIGSTSALHWAVLKGNLDMVKLLLEAGAEINQVREVTSDSSQWPETPLDFAWVIGNKKMHRKLVRYLEEKGAVRYTDLLQKKNK